MKNSFNVGHFLLVTLTIIGLSVLTSCQEDEQLSTVSIDLKLTSPNDSSEAVGTNPVFNWEASDPSGKALTFDLFIGTDKTQLLLQASGLTSTTYELKEYQLKKEETYYWKVVASNGLSSINSDIWSFSSVPSPAAPKLLLPLDSGFVREEITFEWEPVIASPGEKILYDLYFGEDNPPKKIITRLDGKTSFELDASTLDIGKRYYWFVRTSDLISGNASEVASFKRLVAGAPDEPSLVSPGNSKGIFDSNVAFNWEATADPEGDDITYDLFVGEDFPPTNKVAADISATNFSLNSLVAGTSYFWMVEAKDPAGHISSSEIYSFIKSVEGAFSAPEIAQLAIPQVLSLDESFSWNEVIDPDGDTIVYDVYLGSELPLTKKVASGIKGLSYLPDYSDVATDLRDVKTFFFSVTAKDSSGNETRSAPVIFKPQMKGVLVDQRANETVEYDWVRINDQIWLAENVQTTFFNDGTSILRASDSRDVEENFDFETSFFYATRVDSAEWISDRGRVYTYPTVSHENFAPEGWHTMSLSDWTKLRNYIAGDWSLVKTTEFWDEGFEGNNVLGLNLIGATLRRPSGGWRDSFDGNRCYIWASDNNGQEGMMTQVFDNNMHSNFFWDGYQMTGTRFLKD